MIEIADGAGQPYKALSPGDNHHVDILELPNGKWVGSTVSLFDAAREEEKRKKCKKMGIAYNEPPPWKAEHPAARRVMRLHKDDVIKMDYKGIEELMRVESIWQKQVVVAKHNEGGQLDKRDKDKEDSFKYFRPAYGTLKKRRARKVHVDVLGRVRDPGFKAGSKE